MKIKTAVRRFARYESIVSVLLESDSFNKNGIYQVIKNEKPQFIGRVIAELVKDHCCPN